jgi:hypothetical protein
MAKKIKFYSTNTKFELEKPVPASKAVPQWFRKMKNVKDHNMTIKRCVPVLDALTSGYMITLNADMIWDNESESFLTKSKLPMNSDHMPMQTEDMDISDDLAPQPHKWLNYWYIKTPPGYSTLFVHPLNRTDLPFQTIAGVVDTDKHPTPVNFPFFLKKGFFGTIPAGTPIVQAIPFKRDDWNAKIIDQGKSYSYPKAFESFNPPFAWYKRKWWTRKRYSVDNTKEVNLHDEQ